MKTAFKLLCVGMLISTLCAAFTACGDKINLPRDVYYVAGFDSNGYESLSKTSEARVYLLVSENLRDTVAVFNRVRVETGGFGDAGNLLNDMFDFPWEELTPTGICGFVVFPDEYRHSFPVKIKSWRDLTEEEMIYTGNWCAWDIRRSNIDPRKLIVVESLTKAK